MSWLKGKEVQTLFRNNAFFYSLRNNITISVDVFNDLEAPFTIPNSELLRCFEDTYDEMT